MDDFEVLAASERNTTEVDPSSWIIEDVGKTETIATEGASLPSFFALTILSSFRQWSGGD